MSIAPEGQEKKKTFMNADRYKNDIKMTESDSSLIVNFKIIKLN